MQSTSNGKSIGGKILHNPLTRIVIGLFAVLIVSGITQSLLALLFDALSVDKDIKIVVIATVGTLLALLTYFYLYKFYEKRQVVELSKKGITKHLFLGLLLGSLLQSLTVFIIYLYGDFSIISINSVIIILPALVTAASAAILEELLFRGIIFRIAEEKLGSYIALAISGLLFGLIHLGNPNSSLYAALGLAIQAGLLLGAAYVYSKNLWFPIAIHFAWNFTQSSIFGVSTSGHAVKNSLLTTKLEGSELITGGLFGPEGSIQATLFCLTATIILLVLSHRQNKIIQPYWKQTIG